MTQPSRNGFYNRAGKRLLDVVVAGSALVALFPMWAGVALAIRWSMGAPVLFRQPRTGLDGRQFDIIKFRTMSDARDEAGELLPDAARLSPLGRWLRRTTLDEIPELVNVVKGEMSLVGPRPLLAEYVAVYSSTEARRHEVRPGLTGWAVVHGRNAVSWEERLKLDVWYVENRCFLLDLKILARTVVLVLQRHGVSTPGHETAPRLDEARLREIGR